MGCVIYISSHCRRHIVRREYLFCRRRNFFLSLGIGRCSFATRCQHKFNSKNIRSNLSSLLTFFDISYATGSAKRYFSRTRQHNVGYHRLYQIRSYAATIHTCMPTCCILISYTHYPFTLRTYADRKKTSYEIILTYAPDNWLRCIQYRNWLTDNVYKMIKIGRAFG